MRLALLTLLAVWPGVAAPQAPAPASAIQVTGSHLLRTPAPGILGPRVPLETETEFLTTDPAVFYMLTYTGAHKDDRIRVEWRSPAGAVVQENDHLQVADGAMRLVWKLPIAGGPASLTPGDWQVHLFYNDKSIANASFKIAAPPETAVNIATRTVLPEATISVPYFLQMTAHGGKAPYRWSAVKALPNGLTLSATGAVSGTPLRRGSYRAIVKVEDSAGSSEVRTFGIGVGVLAAGDAQVGAHGLFKVASQGACSQTPAPANFSSSDASVVLAVSLQTPRGREGRVEWLNPNGEVVQVSKVTKAAERQECVVKTLPLAGHKAAQEPGDWRVRLFWADLEVFTLKFTVSPSKDAAPPVRAGRIAILIANRSYLRLPPAQTPAADIDALGNALRQDGFEVIRVSDASLDSLRQVEHTLEEKLHAGDTALIYYSGYDARTAGDEWLLPVDFDPAGAGPIQSRAYSAVRLLQWLEDSKAALKFVFLDGAPGAGQPADNPGGVLAEVDESTALVYSRSSTPGLSARALAEVLAKNDVDARTALAIELPKAVTKIAPSSPAPVAILGGGADFIFHANPPH